MVADGEVFHRDIAPYSADQRAGDEARLRRRQFILSLGSVFDGDRRDLLIRGKVAKINIEGAGILDERTKMTVRDRCIRVTVDARAVRWTNDQILRRPAWGTGALSCQEKVGRVHQGIAPMIGRAAHRSDRSTGPNVDQAASLGRRVRRGRRLRWRR